MQAGILRRRLISFNRIKTLAFNLENTGDRKVTAVCPELNPSITPYPNGPYYVNDVAQFSNRHGPIRTTPTMTVVLCRCGASARKPFCDGTHVKIGFSSANLGQSAEDKSVSDAVTHSPEAHDDDVPQTTVAIFVEPNGPYVVTGGPELRNTVLNEGSSRRRFALCRCGGSGNKPFCDGSHRKIGFKDERN